MHQITIVAVISAAATVVDASFGVDETRHADARLAKPGRLSWGGTQKPIKGRTPKWLWVASR